MHNWSLVVKSIMLLMTQLGKTFNKIIWLTWALSPGSTESEMQCKGPMQGKVLPVWSPEAWPACRERCRSHAGAVQEPHFLAWSEPQQRHPQRAPRPPGGLQGADTGTRGHSDDKYWEDLGCDCSPKYRHRHRYTMTNEP